MTAAHTASQNPVDRRVADKGGTRRNTKERYTFPGMQDWPSWSRTPVHQVTAYYGCHPCGVKFSTPAAVYGHLAKRHGV